MIELRKETIYVEGDHGRLAMTYTLQAEPAGALGLEYGITVCDRSSGTSITIQDITNQPLQARALFEKLVAGVHREEATNGDYLSGPAYHRGHQACGGAVDQ